MKKLNLEEIEEARQLYKAGYTSRYIARKLGVKGNTTIIYWVNENYRQNSLNKSRKKYDQFRKLCPTPNKKTKTLL
jgi:uncharacterized protein YjcR